MPREHPIRGSGTETEMGTKTAKAEHQIGLLGETGYGLHAMYDADGYGEASMVLRFGAAYGGGLTAGFHASTAEVREFARQLVEYANAADKAQAVAQEVEA